MASRLPIMSPRRIATPGQADACYFRSSALPGHRKALLKITDRCDLRCAHCFVSATAVGADMPLEALKVALPRLQDARVATVTITGGEPLVHPDLPAILEVLRDAGLDVTICTNGVSVTDELIDIARRHKHVKFNVSLDGLSKASHGRFRGDRDSFDLTLSNTRRLAEAGLLKGVLSTPNALAEGTEYEDLYAFVDDLGADYLLMNPLSSFGRGIHTRQRLQADSSAMQTIWKRVSRRAAAGNAEAVFIRFPNASRALTPCIAGDIFYVFVDGSVTVCPYLVFATENPGAKHERAEFIVGNLFEDADIADRLDAFDFAARYPMGTNDTCRGCIHSSGCGKGCPAAVIASGKRIGALDVDVCPVAPTVEAASD